ncbi:mycofactocin biosynthesis glycosyltransferase MftF [Microbacterium aquimaris]|uniref:mycofactocin biosynthesis glycosyltransferase MftF n=1 Tax=Microbacterium aquimaris TaxID=459816 RepID=UPI002AD342FE|nr:mycofactocin biosynthesis glycosyltransferase MftF [Microbacterium aquimaris]MDZ8276689.1 mycofactocin biosynthesis glycosyltransferase MftF [Microbacterium aquimaris]
MSLADGFTVRLGRRTQLREGGRVLVGGSPTRVARLTPVAAALIVDRQLIVRGATGRALAEHLMAAGLAEPVASSLSPIPLAQLSVVIPVKDRSAQLARLLASIPPAVAETIVVDDGSDDADAVAAVARSSGAVLVAHPDNRGSAAARNTGLSRVRTPFVAFIDSDVVVEPECFDTLLRHFADPRLAMAAPRVLGLEGEAANWITRYENSRSSLDLGTDSASVRPRSPVTWVSSTCLVARVDRLGAGFDPSMHVGEDVDLVWRLVAEGLRVRFEPAAVVRHEHRTHLRTWLGRKFFYGTGAHPLAARHPVDIPPVVLPPWGAVLLVALLAQRRWSIPVALATAVVVANRIARRIGHVHDRRAIATHLTLSGVAASIAQGFALLVRHWWPAAALGSVFSRRLRRAVLLAAVADAVWEFVRLRPGLDPLRFGLARRLDDLAYGAGVWWGALRGRSLAALRPALTRTSGQRGV